MGGGPVQGSISRAAPPPLLLQLRGDVDGSGEMAIGRVHVTSRKVDECAEERDEDIRAGVVAAISFSIRWGGGGGGASVEPAQVRRG